MSSLVLGFLCAIGFGLVGIVVFTCVLDLDESYKACLITFGIAWIILYFVFCGVGKTLYQNQLIAMNMQLQELESRENDAKGENNHLIVNQIANMKASIFLKEKEKEYWWNWDLR